MEINFEYEIGDLVTTKPFNRDGKLVVPKHDERYKIVGRDYVEGVAPHTTLIKSVYVYHCKREGAMFNKDKEKIYTVRGNDIVPWTAINVTNVILPPL